jgi:hypothetical protein
MKNYSLEEKVYLLLQEIDELRQMTPSDEPISLVFHNKVRPFNFTETPVILKKLEKDDQIISITYISDGVIRSGQAKNQGGHIFTITDKFDSYYQGLKERLSKSQNQQEDIIKQKVEGFSIDTIENYLNLLNTIKNKHETTPTNENVKLSCANHYHGDHRIFPDLVDILTKKLQSDFSIIRIISFDKGDMITGYGNRPEFQIKIIEDKFLNFLKLVENRFQSLSNKTGNQSSQSLKSDNLRISYSEHSREIILNDLFLISKPDFDSENERVFDYLYKNPNRTIGKGEIIEDLKISLTKDFNKIVENLKFKKDLRKAFFDISQDSIKFYNPVSKERLAGLGIKNIPIEIK